jgi:hypothetical protein
VSVEESKSTERWIMRDGGHYCTAHDHAFPRGEVCHLCATDPGPAIDVTSAAVVDREAQAAESEVRAASRTLRRLADELAEGTPIEQSLGVKYFAEYLKSMRLWREMHTERLQIESDERLVEHDRKMAGLRGHN